MNQHGGSFDPNQEIPHHIIYDTSSQQNQQPNYNMQGYEMADVSGYLVQNPQAQNVVNYASSEYNPQQQLIPNMSYYESESMPAPQIQVIYEQAVPMQASPVSNSGHHEYYLQGGVSTRPSTYAYYEQPVGMNRQNQYGQYGAMMQNYGGHQQFQLRPQPMTPEQLQLSQQRLLGLVSPRTTTEPPPQVQMHYSQPQLVHQHSPQQQQQQAQMLQHSPQQIQQPQFQHQVYQQAPQQLHQSQQQQMQSVQQNQQTQQHVFMQMQPLQQPQNQPQPVGNYGQFNVPTTIPHGSPAGSSYTSSGSTDISDEGDDLFGAPSPYKRSPTSDAPAKRHGKKRRVQKDPNEPQKPVSAYALFFRDTQAAIKGQNPNASFGDVSKIVASMWDNLDADGKNAYKQKTEMAKKDYLKQLAAYRANLLSTGNCPSNETGSSSTSLQYTGSRNQLQQQQSSGDQKSIHGDTSTSGSATLCGKTLATLIAEPKPQQLLSTTTTSVIVQQQLPASMRPRKQDIRPESLGTVKSEGVCIRPGCNKPSVECAHWDGEYCTDTCVSKHCRDIFTAWVKNRQEQQNQQTESGSIVPI